MIKSKKRAEKDGVWPTITYACARMRYGRGRCVIGTLSVVDRERVLLPRMRRRTALPAGAKRLNVQKCGGRVLLLHTFEFEFELEAELPNPLP